MNVFLNGVTLKCDETTLIHTSESLGMKQEIYDCEYAKIRVITMQDDSEDKVIVIDTYC